MNIPLTGVADHDHELVVQQLGGLLLANGRHGFLVLSDLKHIYIFYF